MECFYHPETAAAGICKNCQRGICRDCIAEVTDGIACLGRCELQATSIGRTVREGAHAILVMGIMIAALGLVFLSQVVVDYLRYGGFAAFPFVAGGVFVTTGMFMIARWLMTRRRARGVGKSPDGSSPRL